MRQALLISSTVLATALGGPAIAQDAGAALQMQTSEEYGQYLADGEGRSLYMFEADTQGEGATVALSTCYDDCAAAWPPFLAPATDVKGGEGVEADLIDSVERKDGSAQVTYNGWPLYYYAEDEAPGETKGQDVEEFGAEWYLLAPSGEIVHD